jgi:hypothetical protein
VIQKSHQYNESTKDISELFDQYLDRNRMFHFEGTDGVRKLDSLCGDLGYTDGQFIRESPIMNFLADNPGATESIIEFIRDHISHITEWQYNLELDAGDDSFVPSKYMTSNRP